MAFVPLPNYRPGFLQGYVPREGPSILERALSSAIGNALGEAGQVAASQLVDQWITTDAERDQSELARLRRELLGAQKGQAEANTKLTREQIKEVAANRALQTNQQNKLILSRYDIPKPFAAKAYENFEYDESGLIKESSIAPAIEKAKAESLLNVVDDDDSKGFLGFVNAIDKWSNLFDRPNKPSDKKSNDKFSRDSRVPKEQFMTEDKKRRMEDQFKRSLELMELTGYQ